MVKNQKMKLLIEPMFKIKMKTRELFTKMNSNQKFCSKEMGMVACELGYFIFRNAIRVANGRFKA